MSEKDYYPLGAYNDPNAPYNQSDLDLLETEYDVTLHAEIKCKVFADTSQKVYDDEEREVYEEQVDDHIYIAEKEIKLPDLKWHSFSKEKPKLGARILIRSIIKARKYYLVEIFDSNFNYRWVGFDNLEWQYINEESYDITIESKDIELA